MRRSLRARRRALLRETTFVLGGALVIALGVAFAAGLAWAGAGWQYAGGWAGAAFAVGFGAFCVYVGRAETADRRRQLRAVDADALQAGPPKT